MDARVMAVVTAAITVERLASADEHTACAMGGAIAGVGLLLIA